MNYTLDISSDSRSIKNRLKKLEYSDIYTKQDVASKVREAIKTLGLNKCKLDKTENYLLFYLLDENDNVCANIKAAPYNSTEKIVIDFAEHKYFKNLKDLFGAYKTETTQKESSSDITTEAYVRSVIGTNFNITDLTSTDKFVSMEEIDLRSPYTESLNNIMFQATHDFEGEIYGITDDGQLYVSGKRIKPHQRLYDTNLISTLDDISPATVENDILIKDAAYGTSIDFNFVSLEKPKLMNLEIKTPINSSYNTVNDPVFRFYKNLLLFEAKVDLTSPRVGEKPDFDDGTFALVTEALSAGDTIEGAIALSGTGTRTHTITTNIKQRCKYLAANDVSLIAIMADNKVYTADNVNYDAVNSITMSTDNTEFSVNGATLVDMIYDEDERSWVGTFGFEESAGTDFYGDKYYKFMISKSLNSIKQAGANASSMYAAPFEQNVEFFDFASYEFDKIVVADLDKKDQLFLTILDNYDGAFGYNTSNINPQDIAISSCNELDITDVEDTTDITNGVIYEDVDNNKKYLEVFKEGPYIVDEKEYKEDGAKMYQKIFSDGDIDVVLQQNYIFVKNTLYTVNADVTYTEQMTRGKHWIPAKMPMTIDTTMLKLHSMPVTGENSCWNYVHNDIENFCSWALDTARKDENSDNYIFTDLSLNETFTKAELDDYKAAIQPLSGKYSGNSTSGKGLLTYTEFLSLGVSYYSGNKKLNVTNDSYSTYNEAVDRVTFETALPLNSDLKVDSSKRFILSFSRQNLDFNVIENSEPYKNVVNFEEAYLQYLYLALVYVRGSKLYDSFGAKAVTNIYSFGNNIYFRCYTGDIFFINKKYLHKRSDIEDVNNWNTSVMPAASFVNGWDTSDLTTIAGYDTVWLKTNKQLPINNKQRHIYFYKITSNMFTMSDNKHIFFGGYAFPAKKIYDKYNDMGGGAFDITQEWWKNNLNNWISDNNNSGNTPVVIYSNDGGATFNILPVRQYLPSSIYSDGINRQVGYFTETPDGKIAAYVQENNAAYMSNQIVINFDSATSIVDSTATEWKQVGIPTNGEVRSFDIDGGKITYSTGPVGYGVDASQVAGSNTFNFEYTGNNVITIPSGLSISKVEPGNCIKFNKAITEDSNVSGTYRVLFAAYTNNDISFQEDYMTKDSSILNDYIKSNGQMKLDYIKEVNNYLNANRVYVENFVSVEDDIDKVYYEYEDDKPLPFKNGNGNSIIHCNNNGSLFAVKVGDDEQFINMGSSLGNYVTEEQLVVASKTKTSLDEFASNATVMATEKEFTTIVKNNKDYVAMNDFNQDSLNTHISINNKVADVLSKYGVQENDDSVNDIYDFVVSMEDSWGFPDNNFENAASRFEFKTVGNSKYLYDKKYNAYVINKRAYICGTLMIPYTYYNGGAGMTVIPNPIIEYDDNNNLKNAGAYVNGIYYHPMGYGGLRNNNSITNSSPWKRDPKAFENSFLKNSFGEYVYITDERGTKVDIYNADQVIENGKYKITYDSFNEYGENFIYRNGDNADIVNSFYKLKKTEIHQSHSCDFVKKGSKVKLRFYKNTTRITDIKFEDGSTSGILYNSLNEPCYEATLDKDILIVGEPLNRTGDILTAKFKVSWTINKKQFSDTVSSSFTLYKGNGAVWVDTFIDDVDTLVYYKDFLISKFDENVLIRNEQYEISLSDDDGAFDLSTAEIEDNNVSSTIEDGKIIIKIAANIDYTERSLSVNGITVWKAPIINITDDIIKSNKTYLGDTVLLDDFNISDDDIKEINQEALSIDYEKEFTTKDLIISGAYGKSISRKPKYNNLQDLLFNEGMTIEKNVKYNENELTSMKVAEVASDNSEIKLNKPIEIEKYNDGIEHYFRFKILTIADQELAPKNMNDSSYYRELSKEEMKQFAPNRVWYNPKGSPVPPINVGSKIFNAENNYAYYSNEYKNNNGSRIYICNENGHYINYNENGDAYDIGNENGDCSNNVYTGVDNRYVSPEPINPTCQDWFYENMYTPNKEVNPLWQIINISPKLHNKKWEQSANLYRYKKLNNSQVLTSEIDYPFITVNSISKITSDDNLLSVDKDIKILDIDTGLINLFFTEGSDKYKELINNNNGELTLYGLNFNVNKISDIYKNDFIMNGTVQADYTVNTLRDFRTPVQNDSTIARITELGIFDKNHVLIGYAQFPPIEYRTDTQHASFTAVIYHGNMVQNE